MATFYYNAITPSNKAIAEKYFQIDKWYYSSLSGLYGKFKSVEKSEGYWGLNTWSFIMMLSPSEWELCSSDKVEELESLRDCVVL